MFQKKAIYRFLRNYWANWFPDLPTYQAFCNRLNRLEASFQIISCQLLRCLSGGQILETDYLVDSFPVMLAKAGFARRARVAREFASIGYCAAKRMHFHGIRLHLLARCRSGRLPLPSEIWFRSANVHDLTAFKEQRPDVLSDSALFGDKAFGDAALKQQLKAQNTQLFVPLKKPQGKDQSQASKYYSRLVSRIRQPIESFFKWLNDKTQIKPLVRCARQMVCYYIVSENFHLLCFC